MKTEALSSLIKIAEEEGEPYVAPESVSHFFDNIATPKRKKYNKEHGFSPIAGNLLYPGFYNDVVSRTINGVTSLGGVGDSGYTGDFVEYQPGYYKARPKIQISRKSQNPDATAVHEYTHSRNNDSRYALRKFKQEQPEKPDQPPQDIWTVQLDPAVMDIRQKLENIYHIAENYKNLPYDPIVENAPTHAEHQFMWMNNAAGKLGHLPSVAEYDDFINNVPLIELKKKKRCTS